MSDITTELERKVTEEQENKWYPVFEKRAQYKGNGIYNIGRLYSKCTSELFLMFVADMENIDYVGKVEESEDEVE